MILVPTLSEWGLIILALYLGLTGMWMMRRREREQRDARDKLMMKS